MGREEKIYELCHDFEHHGAVWTWTEKDLSIMVNFFLLNFDLTAHKKFY